MSESALLFDRRLRCVIGSVRSSSVRIRVKLFLRTCQPLICILVSRVGVLLDHRLFVGLLFFLPEAPTFEIFGVGFVVFAMPITRNHIQSTRPLSQLTESL